MRAYIFGAGSYENSNFYNRIVINDWDLIVCADGGYDFLKANNIVPHVVLGDLDSVRTEIDSGIQVQKFPKHKDKTDMHIAVDYCLEKGYKEIVIFGGLGGRYDHTVGNMILLKYIFDRGGEGLLANRDTKITMCGSQTVLKKGNSKYISLIPYTDYVVGVTTHGLAYELSDYTLNKTENLGISNEFVQNEATISVKDGLLYIIITK